MKYIRTKSNDIMLLLHNEKEWKNLSQKQTGGLSYKQWFEIATSNLDILRSGDTIEELCDEFVAVNDSMDLPILDSFENICLLLTTKEHKDDDVYGAMWTDKGLIYVAKMNDKGELELI